VKISDIEYLSAAFAGLGGLAAFLLACAKGTIRNNRYSRKGALEVGGGALGGFFLSWAATAAGAQDLWRVGVAFIGGLGWAFLVELVRKKISNATESALKNALPGGGTKAGGTVPARLLKCLHFIGLTNLTDGQVGRSCELKRGVRVPLSFTSAPIVSVQPDKPLLRVGGSGLMTTGKDLR
jgi:hypothetical protein